MKSKRIPTPQRLERLKRKRKRLLRELMENWEVGRQRNEFFARVRKTEKCWPWIGMINSAGYSFFFYKGFSLSSHQISYITTHKKMIPKGLCIDHICRNRKCVNPKHLRLLTNKENVLLGIGLTAKNSRKKRCWRGHKFLPVKYRGMRVCSKCRIMRRKLSQERAVKRKINLEIKTP